MNLEGNPLQVYGSPVAEQGRRRSNDRLMKLLTRLLEGIVQLGVIVIAGLLRLILLTLKQIVRPR
ncbi:hypothetical protein [Filimonas effusa]|uniref:Uncharacterized protein n=1 Tax=Filimonas effusa TaxID=2508721 RepID=A0A4V1MAK6_9BACT|nr:hypothetical protein [Filimonas effusa]RXK86206.1 hypothetical protein ESB13_05205 [Filimonas effusa]